MRPYKKLQKVDLNNEYPCPCRRRGRLLPIVLTEAFGCDRCQQIFVLQDNGQVIEQLSSIYHKRAWKWTGNRWTTTSSNWARTSLSFLWATVLMLPIITIVALPFALRLSSSQSIIFWAMILLLLIVLPAFMVWLAYRH